MIKRMIRISSVVLTAVIIALTLSSCFGMGTNQASTETESTVPAPDLVLPTDVAGEIDRKAEDPSNDDIKFYYDDEGRVAQCEYKKDDVSFYVGYTYRDGTVDVNTYASDAKGNPFVLDSRTYKVGDFNKSAGFAIYDGYYFKGYTDFDTVERENVPEDTLTTAPETTAEPDGTDSAEDTAEATGTEAATDTEAVTDTAEVTETETEAVTD